MILPSSPMAACPDRNARFPTTTAGVYGASLAHSNGPGTNSATDMLLLPCCARRLRLEHFDVQIAELVGRRDPGVAGACDQHITHESPRGAPPWSASVAGRSRRRKRSITEEARRPLCPPTTHAGGWIHNKLHDVRCTRH